MAMFLYLYLYRVALLALAASLLPAGAGAQTPPNASERAAYVGIQAAADRGDVKVLSLIQPADPGIDRRDGHGRTALLIAGHARHKEAVRVLARAGADLNAKDSQHYDLVTIASVANDVDLLALALALGASAKQITSPYHGTALIAAAHLGHAEVVRRLIAAGAPLDHVNNLGWTAVMEAVVLGDGGADHQATLKALLDAGADASIPDRAGLTPLQHAERRDYRAMVTMLGAAKPNAR